MGLLRLFWWLLSESLSATDVVWHSQNWQALRCASRQRKALQTTVETFCSLLELMGNSRYLLQYRCSYVVLLFESKTPPGPLSILKQRSWILFRSPPLACSDMAFAGGNGLQPKTDWDTAHQVFHYRQTFRGYVDRFLRLDKNGKGHLGREDFLMIPELAINPLGDRIVHAFCTLDNTNGEDQV